MRDNILIAIDKNIRIYVANTTQVINVARQKHGLLPVASVALGRTITAVSIMGTMLKGDQNIVAVINGGGPLGTIMAESDAQGNIRGYVSDPTVHVTYNESKKLAIGYAVGQTGGMQIIKDLKLKEAFTGNVGMIKGEIAEEFTYYFASSEQTPSVVALSTIIDVDNTVKASGGVVIQLLPEHTEADIIYVESILSKLDHYSMYLEQGKTTDQILLDLFPTAKKLDTRDIRFNCKCGKEKMISAFVALGKHDLLELANERDGTDITCKYCNESVHFSKQDLLDIAKNMK